MDQNCPIGCPFPKLQLCSVQVYILILHSSISCVTIQKACKQDTRCYHCVPVS